MRLRTRAIIGAVLSVPLLFTSLVLAQTAPGAPQSGGAFAQRLDQRKKERAIVLDVKTQKRLTDQCTSAQTNIRAMQQRLTPLFTDRAKTYQHLDGKLWVTVGQLKLADKDTFKLEQDRALLAEKVTNVKATTANFQQTLDDIVVINCKADVVGFKALVDTARLYLTQVRDQSAAIRSYEVDQIKPELAAQVSDLQPKSPAEGGQ